MTFFANSGIRIPKEERRTRKSGKKSLTAGSKLWKLLSILEDYESESSFNTARVIAKELAVDLSSLANDYSSLSDASSSEWISATEYDVEIARIGPIWDFYEWNGMFPVRPPPRGYDRKLNLKTLYRDLSRLMDRLAASIEQFIDSEMDRPDRFKSLSRQIGEVGSSEWRGAHRGRNALANQAFDIMRQWEVIAKLARLISVVNQTDGLEPR